MKERQFNTPILLITFNRPDHVRKSLTEIRKQRPAELYVAQDGPREGNESDALKVQQVRGIINELVDWPCNLHTLYQEKNLGCGPGPFAAISWFFEKVEMGIVLEDDCIPHEDFFDYCSELLERFKNDTRICHIGGNNNGYAIKDCSYSFASGHHQTWGWASWRRTWQNVDYSLNGINSKQFKKIVRYYYRDLRQQAYWWKIFSMVKKDRMNDSCWDYQYMFSCWKQKMMAISPKVNLVSNIGDGIDATHTKGRSDVLHVPVKGILPLSHPKDVRLNIDIDDYMMREHIISYQYGLQGIGNFPFRLNYYIKQLVGHEGPWLK